MYTCIFIYFILLALLERVLARIHGLKNPNNSNSIEMRDVNILTTWAKREVMGNTESRLRKTLVISSYVCVYVSKGMWIYK